MAKITDPFEEKALQRVLLEELIKRIRPGTTKSEYGTFFVDILDDTIHIYGWFVNGKEIAVDIRPEQLSLNKIKGGRYG